MAITVVLLLKQQRLLSSFITATWVVVWEWLNEHGRWRPYSAAVCHHIENVLKGDAREPWFWARWTPSSLLTSLTCSPCTSSRQDTGKRQNSLH
uniref:WWE domain-containing protein n=1 Tax=Myripristis murdjan TaxID=586833 RepID=A0A668AND8_9TELE